MKIYQGCVMVVCFSVEVKEDKTESREGGTVRVNGINNREDTNQWTTPGEETGGGGGKRGGELVGGVARLYGREAAIHELASLPGGKSACTASVYSTTIALKAFGFGHQSMGHEWPTIGVGWGGGTFLQSRTGGFQALRVFHAPNHRGSSRGVPSVARGVSGHLLG